MARAQTLPAGKPARPVLTVVDPTSRDTIRALEDLLAQARRGEVVGVAYAALHPGRTFSTHRAGGMHECPLLARGAVAVLGDEIGRVIAGMES